MLFLTEDNDFAGREQEITHEEVIDGENYSHTGGTSCMCAGLLTDPHGTNSLSLAQW
jgi:hypothetical protein